jgi:hypothetical protein
MGMIENLMKGSIDMHVHHGPDARTERRLDALEAAVQAEKAGMRAIVLKNRDYPTAPVAYIVNQSVHSITVFGSISLDFGIGGLNYYAVESSALLGAKVVWMPTFSSANHKKKLGLEEEGINILNSNGKIIQAAANCLDVIKKHSMVLATGHISTSEIYALVDEALLKGITKIVITHPLNSMVGATMSIQEQKQMAAKGAFIEHCIYNTLPLGGRLDPMEIVEAVRAIGAEHCILTTDLGQNYNPTPAEGMRMMIATLLKCSLSDKEIELMIKINPAKLLDLTFHEN